VDPSPTLPTVSAAPIAPSSALPAAWDAPWAEVDHVVLDLETTGIDPARDRICELAFTRRTAGGRVVDRLEALVRPLVPVGPSSAVHGLSDEALERAEALEVHRARLARALDGAILVGHRIAYDLGFLRAASERGELEPPPEHALDTQKLAMRCLHGVPTSLRGLCEAHALPLPTHRAGPDVLATAALFDVLVGVLRPASARDLWVSQAVEGKAQIRGDVRAVIEEAIERSRVVRLTYRVPGRPPLEDELEPWALVGAHVEGQLARKGRKVLRGDRILRAELGERAFQPPLRWASGLPR
jgi:DNA polymerase-3 subunit epsilon